MAKAKVVAVKKESGKEGKMPPWMKGKEEEKPMPKKGKK